MPQEIITICSDNDLSSNRRHQRTNAGLLLIGPLETNFGEISIEIVYFREKKNEFENVIWKMAAILTPLQCVEHLLH